MRAWKEQALLREEREDRSFQGNISQQLLPTIPVGSLLLHCDSKAGLRVVHKLLPAAGDVGVSAVLQPRAACKPRGSERG